MIGSLRRILAALLRRLLLPPPAVLLSLAATFGSYAIPQKGLHPPVGCYWASLCPSLYVFGNSFYADAAVFIVTLKKETKMQFPLCSSRAFVRNSVLLRNPESCTVNSDLLYGRFHRAGNHLVKYC